MPTRRNLLLASLISLATAAFRTIVPRAMADTGILSDADVDRLLHEISNWGRWGPEDQLGTLNFITVEMRLAAARSIRTGRVVPLAHERPVADPDGVRKLSYQMMRYQDSQPEESGCIDQIGMIYHGYTITHLDALCHLFTPQGAQGMYNGFPIAEVTDQARKSWGSR